jgi:WD40 repeat protein
MTKDGSNARKQAAHELAQAEQIPYTEALRRLDERPSATSVRVMQPIATITPDATLLGHTNPIASIAFHPDCRSLASGADITARIWDLASGQTVTGLTQEAGVRSIALSPDGGTMAVGGADGSVTLWTVGTGEISTLTGCDGMVQWLGFSPDGRTVAATGESRGQRPAPENHFTPPEASIRFWDLDTGRTTAWTGPSGEPVVLHPDGHSLFGAHGRDSVRQWSLNGELVGELTGHTSVVQAAAITSDGRLLATGAADTMVRIWDLASGETAVLINPRGGYVTAVAFSPDGRTLATGTNGGVARLWDSATGRNTATLHGHNDSITAQAFSPDGRTLATGGFDATIRLWAVP